MSRLPLYALPLLGCATTAPAPRPAPAPAPPAAEPSPPAPPAAAGATSTSCFFGGLYVTPAGAGESHQGELLIKLTFDPSASTIIEETFAFPLFERWQVVRAVSGSRFSMRQDDGAFTGDGELEGEPWGWSSWRSTTSSADGGTRVESTARLVDGALVAEDKVMTAAGVLRDTLRYALEPIEPGACDDMFARAQAAVNEARARAAAAMP